MSVRNAKDAFISRGFCNWKLATSVFRQHELRNCHKEAVEKIITLPATTSDVGEMLSKAHAQEKSENRQVLLTILSNLRFLARQACAIRGDGNENDSNFIQLCKLHIHKELTDDLDLKDVATEFISGSEHRLSIFGKF